MKKPWMKAWPFLIGDLKLAEWEIELLLNLQKMRNND